MTHDRHPDPATALSHDGQPGLLRTDTKTKVTPGGQPAQLHERQRSGARRRLRLRLDRDPDRAGGRQLLAEHPVPRRDGRPAHRGREAADHGGRRVRPKPALRRRARHRRQRGRCRLTDGLANGRTDITLTEGSHTLSVTEAPDASGSPVQVRLNWVTPAQRKANTNAAITAAEKANTAVVFAWADAGTDLSSPLPEGQDQLIEDIAKVNPNTIVVLNTGEPVAMPWLHQVSPSWKCGTRVTVAATRPPASCW